MRERGPANDPALSSRALLIISYCVTITYLESMLVLSGQSIIIVFFKRKNMSLSQNSLSQNVLIKFRL